MANCTQINIPELDVEAEACNGKYYSTLCVIHKPPLVPLGFPEGNASLAQILPAISNKLFDQQSEIDSLNEQISEIQVGGEGIVWRGAWVSGSDYEQNDIVEYLGSSYICVVDVNNSVSNPLADTSNWDLLAQKGSNGAPGTPGLQGLIWRGLWNYDSDYDPGDAVEYEGSSYICTVQNTFAPPPGNLASWDLLAQKGANGSPNYLEFSAKLEQTDIAPPEIIGTYIDEISIGTSQANPLYRGFLSSRVITGTYRVGFEWIKLSPSAIPVGKLEITMTGGNITVVQEEAYSTVSPGTTAGCRFLIEVRDSDGILSDDALGILFVAGVRFRLFTV